MDQAAPLTARPDDEGLSLLGSPLLAPLFGPPPRADVISAWFGHVPFAFWLMRATRPGVLVELGTHNGVSYCAFCEAIARDRIDARAYAVDTWEGDVHAGRYGEEVHAGLRAVHDGRYGQFSTLLRCRFDEALPYFADGSVDLLHIDGLHTYEAVRHDWEAWQPKLTDRAVVLFHDTNERLRDFGVWRLWAELRARYPGFEFLHEHGLGVLAVGRHAPDAVRALCEASPDEIATFRDRFAFLGARWIERNEGAQNLAARRAVEADRAGLRADNEGLRAELVRLEALLAERAAAHADAETAYRDALARMEAARDETRHALRRALRRQHSAEANTGIAAAEQARLAEALAAASGERDAAIATRTDIARRFEAVIGSPAWRASAPLRAAGTRFPAAANGGLRAARLAALLATGRLGGRAALRRRVRDDAAAIEASRLFDRAFYAERYPEVAASGADPLWHFIWVGAASDFDPNPLFDTGFYRARHPGLEADGTNPLAHYVRDGAASGDDPHPLFDTAHYRAVSDAGAGTGSNALLDYLERGAASGLSPHPWFDPEAYWMDHLREAGRPTRDPLSEYLMRGDALGHDPHPLFDTRWYRVRHPGLGDDNALVHWLSVGRAAGDAPCLLLEQSQGAADPEAPLAFAHVDDPAVSIVIPVYGRAAETLRCLHAIARHADETVPYEVIVADDRPSAPIGSRLRAVPGLRVVENPSNVGFLRTCNRAAELARGRAILLLNNDTSVGPGFLAPMLALLDADPRAGLVGAMLLNRDGSIQEAGGIVHDDGWGAPHGAGGDPSRPEFDFVRAVDVAIGACLLVRRTAWEEVGGFDDRYAPAYYEEFDLAFALRDRGWRVLYQPRARVTHSDASSYGREERDRQSTRNHALFCARWDTELEHQPPLDAPAFTARMRPPRAGRMLFIDDRVPEPDVHAGSVSTLHWLRLLRERGVAVTFVPHDRQAPEPYTTVLQQMGVEVLHGAVDLPGWIAANGRFLDGVWSARPGVTEPLLDLFDAHAPGRLIYFTHDLHFLREERRHALEGGDALLAESRRLRASERAIFRRARLVLTPSADEIGAIRTLAPSARTMAIPLYSLPSEPEPADGRAEDDAEAFASRQTVLFVGGYAHTPNVDAALTLAREIFPAIRDAVPGVRLVLAGSKPTPEVLALAGPDIEVPGWVADLTPFYAAARLTLNPIRYGAGVKGKIVASLQHGVPVVTTSVGNEGLALRDGLEAVIADGADALAAAAIALLREPAHAVALASAGRAVIADRFGEHAARRTLDRILGARICPVCGDAHALPDRHATDIAGRRDRDDGCPACGADARAQDLAEAVIRPWRGSDVQCLGDARVLLAPGGVALLGDRAPSLAGALAPFAPAAGDPPALVIADVDAIPVLSGHPPSRIVCAGPAAGGWGAQLARSGWSVTRARVTDGALVIDARRAP